MPSRISVRRPAGLAILALAALCLPALSGCSGDSGSGPAEVKWDRTACERCRMVLSDRAHSAQVRTASGSDASEVYMFDDIGCAVIWLEDKAFRDAPSTEVWVTDWRTGDWIDARQATYLLGQVTPMQYGLGAQPEPATDGITYDQAKAHIFEVEERFNQHASHLEESAREGGGATAPGRPSL